MAGAVPPSVDTQPTGPIDHGTSASIGSPTPGSVGLDAKSTKPGASKAGATAKPTTPSMAEQIVSYARRHRGERVGDGECFTLADRALRGAHAKSAGDHGPVTPTADYIWGRAVNLADLQPGDIIQFRDYSFEQTVVTETADGTRTETRTGGRPHHTAIVSRVDGGGAVTVLEQNVPHRGSVTTNQVFFTAGTTTGGGVTTTTTVNGTFWFYRPEPQ